MKNICMWLQPLRSAVALIAITTLAGPLSAQAPGTITGTVRDPAGLAVPGAQVVFEPRGDGTAREALTDAQGVFRLEDVAPGVHAVIITHPSFQEFRTQVEIDSNRARTLSVTLEIASLHTAVMVRDGEAGQLRDVVRHEYELTKSTTTVDGEMLIRNSPINNYDSLRYMPGVMNAAFGGRDRFSTPSHIRGAGAWGKVETVDDYPSLNITPVSAEDGGYTASFSSIIPSLAVESMSLATGGLGATYGQASGGVVRSFIKRGNPARRHATLHTEGVGIGEFLAMGDLGGGFKRLDYYFSGQTTRGEYGDAYDTFARPIQDLRLASGLAKAGYKVTDKSRAEMLFLGGNERHSFFQTRRDSILQRDVRDDYHTDKANYFLAGRYDFRPSDEVVFGVGATHNEFHENRIQDLANGAPVGISRRNRPQQATSGFADLTWRTNVTDSLSYSGSAGTRVDWDRFRDITNQPVSFSFREQAGYFRNSLVWAKGLAVNAGLRVSRINNGFQDLTQNAYDIGLGYRLPSRNQLKASYSTGYKLNKAFYLWWGGGQFIGREPVTGLRPSETGTTEFAVEQAVVSTSSISGTFRISYFQTREKDLFNFGDTRTGIPYYDDARMKALEIWSQWTLGPFRPFASYTHLKNVRTASSNPAASNVDLRFTPLPNNGAGFGTYVDATRRFSLAVMGFYDDGGITEQFVNDSIILSRFGKYTRMNLAATFVVSHRLNLVFRAENFLNLRDLGFSRTILNPDGTSHRVAGTQRDPGLVLAGGIQLNF